MALAGVLNEADITAAIKDCQGKRAAQTGALKSNYRLTNAHIDKHGVYKNRTTHIYREFMGKNTILSTGLPQKQRYYLTTIQPN